MNNSDKAEVPTFKEWKKTHNNATLNDYYAIFGTQLTFQNAKEVDSDSEIKQNRKSHLKWYLFIALIVLPCLTIVLLPNSNLSLFIKNSIGLSTNQIQGKFIRISNNNKENNLLGALKVKGLVEYIEFNGSHCSFDYFGIKISASFEIDGTKVYINSGGELGTLTMEIVNGNRLEGEGWIDGTFEKK
jgi:hypothetical protein